MVKSCKYKLFFYVYHLIDDYIDNSNAVADIESNLIKRHEDWQHIDAQMVSEEARLALDRRIHCIFYLMGANGMKVNSIFLIYMNNIDIIFIG